MNDANLGSGGSQGGRPATARRREIGAVGASARLLIGILIVASELWGAR